MVCMAVQDGQPQLARQGAKATAAAAAREGAGMVSPFKHAPPPREEAARNPKAKPSKAAKGREDDEAATAPKSTEMFAHLPPYKVLQIPRSCYTLQLGTPEPMLTHQEHPLPL